jgi:transposase
MRAKPWEVPDGLWERIEPLLPRKQRRFRYPGRKPFDDRMALQGILFVLHTGIGWEHLPRARLRLRDDSLAQAARLARGGRLGEAARAAARRVASRRSARMGARDRRLQPSASEKGGLKTGPSPVDRGRRAASTTCW